MKMMLRSFAPLCALLLLSGTEARADECIDNDLSDDTVGYWQVCIYEGAYSEEGYITARRHSSEDIVTENVLYDWRTFIDLGQPGGDDVFALDDLSSEVWQETEDTVHVEGGFSGASEQWISWHATCSIESGSPIMRCSLHFMTQSTQGLGQMRVIQYLDEDVEGSGDDVFQARGSVAQGNLELLTVDDEEVYGVSQGGALSTGQGLVNASFVGWTADIYDEIQDRLADGTAQPLSPSGVIMNLETYQHPVIGSTHGPEDIVTAMGWDVNPSASSATIITTLGGVPEAPPSYDDCVPGDVWPEQGDGVVDLRDFCAAWRALVSGDGLSERASECSDVHPGMKVCSRPSFLPGGAQWCPEGDGRLGLGDIIVIFRVVLGGWTVSCDDCGVHREQVSGGHLRRAGDLVPDGQVDVADAVRALRLSVGAVESSEEDIIRGDVAPFVTGDNAMMTVTGDGVVGIGDVVALLRASVGLQQFQWPLRSVDVVLTSAGPTTGRMVSVAGWPEWAEPGDIAGSACTDLVAVEEQAWGWACTQAGPQSTETVRFPYRAARPVDVATLAIDARGITDVGIQVPLSATVAP